MSKPGELSSTNTEPSKASAIYFVFILLGMATLYPWNAFLNAFDYFSYSLQGNALQYSFMSYVASVYTWTMVLMMVAMVIFQHDRKLGVSTKGFVGLSMNLILFLALSLLPLVDSFRTESILSHSAFIGIILTIVCGTAIGTAVGIRTFYTLISLFPSRYVPAFNAGQAIAGVLVSIVAIVTSGISASAKSSAVVLKSTVFYFASSGLVLLLTLIGFYWLSKQEVYKAAIANFKPDRHSLGQNIETFKAGTKMIWNLAIGIMVVLTVTIALITSCITSAKSSSKSVFWSAIYLPTVFLIYNIGDVAGRWLPAFKAFQFRKRSRKPIILPWLRLVVFLPLFLMSNMLDEPSGLRSHLPRIISSDWLYMIVVFLFGLSSGFAATTLMMIAPEQTERDFIELSADPTEGLEKARGASGSIMGLFLNFGLVLGSLGSFLIRLLI